MNIGAQVHRARERLDHRAERMAQLVDGQTLAGVLVHRLWVFDLLAIGLGVEGEVVGPHRVGLERRVDERARRGNALARPVPGNQQARPAPRSMNARPAQFEALAAQEHANAPVALEQILVRHRLHHCEHRLS